MSGQSRKWEVGALSVFILASLFAGVPQAAQAVSSVSAESASTDTAALKSLVASQFDPGFIISDKIFFDKDAMTADQVQAFLASKLPSCAEANGVKCIVNYRVATPSRDAAAAGNCAAYTGATDESASSIIYRVAQACGINPQVLLVTLQKEQGLITNGSPTDGKYLRAMGYACPDTSACDTRYYGFFNQVYSAAWQYKQYAINASRWRYHIGDVAIQFNPTASCGNTIVSIRNQATANLYNYTPYQPNAAAMANLNGTGDACSAYGNRNFWVYFNNWFGSSTGAVDPIGSLDIASAGPGAIRLAGWVFDPNRVEPTQIHVYVNGALTAFDASGERPDLPPIYGDVGTQHGFDVSVPVTSSGVQQVCVYGINYGPGANSVIACRTLNAMAGSPIGVIDTMTSSAGMITVTGWVLDPDTAGSIPVHIYTDAAGIAYTADVARPDIAAAYPGYGSAHGYAATFAAPPGTHTVCVYGIDIAGSGANSGRGCRSVAVPTGSPIGVIDTVTVTSGSITITGWALDPDTAASIPVHIYTDASGLAFTADTDRPDIALAYPGYGAAHGYSATFAAAVGRHTVCVYGIDIAGTGANSGRGCRVVDVPA